MKEVQLALQVMRMALQLGITAEQYAAAQSKPEISDEELKAILESNTNKIQALIDIDH